MGFLKILRAADPVTLACEYWLIQGMHIKVGNCRNRVCITNGAAIYRQPCGTHSWWLSPATLPVKNTQCVILAQVIMLDADNTPLKNPEVLFESKEYREGGNLYWPDWWDAQGWLRPAAYSLFGIMPPWLKEGGENFITAESGQMILNRCSLTRAYVNLLSRSPGLWSSFLT